MAPSVNFAIQGQEELLRNVRKLEKKVQKRIIRKALGKVARAVVKDARALVPRETGLLRESLGSVIRFGKKTGEAFAVIGPRVEFKGKKVEKIRAGLRGAKTKRKPANYGHLVEFGAKPHKQRFIPVAGGVIRLGGDMHPGARPKPFLRPALEKNKTKALPMMAAEFEKGLAEAL